MLIGISFIDFPNKRKLEARIVGQPVALRGTARSINGHWWFDYRGVKLYVEEMERLPGVNSELHAEPVLVTGVLEEAKLPDIDQISTKNKPDLKKYFIVRKPTVKRIEALLGPELGKP